MDLNMKVYISQLTETENIIDLLEKYDIGLEIVLFASPYCLDKQDEFIEIYKTIGGESIPTVLACIVFFYFGFIGA